MKRIALALFAAAGLAVSAARADNVRISGTIHFGTPVYNAPAYCPPPAPLYCPPTAPAGYWRDQTVEVWVPGHWTTRRDHHGRVVSFWEPPHKECRTQRVWVDSYAVRDPRYRGNGYGPRWNG